MARPKKPNYLKILNGSAKHNSDRHKDDHLIPEPEAELGDAPEHFDAALKNIWSEYVGIIPAGVAFNSDRPALEMLCRITHEIRTEEFKATNFTQFIQLCGRFGLTPSDRQKVKVPEQKKKSGFEDV